MQESAGVSQLVEHLFRHESGRMVSILTGIFGVAHLNLAEDVVQEALIVLYRRLGNVRNPLALAGWIFRVVTRLCMLPVLGLIRGAEELTERHEAEYFAQVPKDELRIDLVRALESLPDMYREVILLRDMEQLTIGEVADHLRITREACKSRIHRGRALLREYLQGDKPRGGKK